MGKENNVNELQLSKSMNNDDKVSLEQDDPRIEDVTFTVSTLDKMTGRRHHQFTVISLAC